MCRLRAGFGFTAIPPVVETLSVAGDFDGQELDANDQDAVLLGSVCVHVAPDEGEEVVVVQLVEFVDETSPQFLAIRRLHLVLVQLADIKVGKVLPEGVVDLVIEGRQVEFAGVGTAQELKCGFVLIFILGEGDGLPADLR